MRFVLYTDHWLWCAGGLEKGGGGSRGQEVNGEGSQVGSAGLTRQWQWQWGWRGGQRLVTLGRGAREKSAHSHRAQAHLVKRPPSQAAPATPGLQEHCPCAGTRRDEPRLLGLGGWGHRGCRWGCRGPEPRAVGVPRLGPGWGLLGFLGSAEVSALRIENGGACPPALERDPPSLVLVAFPAPSSGAFFLGPGVQTPRKPLLFLLLTAGALSCPPGPAVSAP